MKIHKMRLNGLYYEHKRKKPIVEPIPRDVDTWDFIQGEEVEFVEMEREFPNSCGVLVDQLKSMVK